MFTTTYSVRLVFVKMIKKGFSLLVARQNQFAKALICNKNYWRRLSGQGDKICFKEVERLIFISNSCSRDVVKHL